jgi:hypothetical protein
VTRTELGLTEYGPTPTPAYAGAGITAMRSALLHLLSTATPDADPAGFATPSLGTGAEDSPVRHSDRQQRIARLRAQAKFLGVSNG